MKRNIPISEHMTITSRRSTRQTALLVASASLPSLSHWRSLPRPLMSLPVLLLGVPPPSPVGPGGPQLHHPSAGLGFLPAPLHLWSHNARGLNAPERRSHLLRSLWESWVSIAFLQETHFRGVAGPALRDSRYPVGYFANHPSAKKAGVAVLFASTVFRSIADTKYTFGCIYAPNTWQHCFLRSKLHKLEQFRERLLVVSGNLNVARTAGEQERTAQITAYLQQYVTKTLSQEDVEALEAPITLEELQAALKSAKLNKAPGLDGLPVCYIKEFGDVLLSRLLRGIR
ncbi:Hypothetical predicted protein [Pelobates cultripes]|uniref:Endonuclease/exonuclease/phosphatase domain-containing protein n=1 Tax=Pelobates cultripes TaxID=61616 RepID=A0AAD1T887_PELCU|nr:Hypothetical predicted protein [Pelobates cultripes]